VLFLNPVSGWEAILRRREFITLLGGAATWPVTARAQQSAIPVIGFLHVAPRSDEGAILPGFRQGLREVGFVEGQNVAIEYRWAENQNSRLPVLAAELVQRRVQVIATGPNLTNLAAAKAATTVIPIVFMSGPDPVRAGLIASLSQPGGNLTGITELSAELTAKRLGLLHELAPQAATVAMLLDGRPGVAGNQNFNFNEAESAGRKVGLQLIDVRMGAEADFDSALASAVHEGAGALLVSSSVFLVSHRDEIVAAAAKNGLPAIYQQREYAVAGGVMSYGADQTDAYRQVGVYTGRILKGEKPGDLPVQQPTKVELVINLKTAKALGLTVPPNLLALVDEVIE
jgi:putative tryptophan/tyrosine transport system substrate-binding protein